MKEEAGKVTGKKKPAATKAKTQAKAGARKAPAGKTAGKKRALVAPGKKAPAAGRNSKKKVVKKAAAKVAKKQTKKKARSLRGGPVAPRSQGKPGRPSIFTAELAAGICQRLAAGDSLRRICAEPGMPHRGTVKAWREEREEFSSQYARANEDGSDLMLEEMLTLADDRSQDLIPSEFGPKPNSAAVSRARLQVDLRKWILAKREPDRFGDKVQAEVTGAGGKPMELTVSPEALAAIQAASAAAAMVRPPAGSRETDSNR